MKKAFFALSLVLLLLPFVSSAEADHFVFGPEAFDRSEGAPNVFDETFPSNEGKGFLVVFNGDDEQDSRVSSGSVVLNGNLVVGPDKLNEMEDRISEQVPLADTNTLQITLDGDEDAGAYIIVMIVTDSKNVPEFTAGRIQLAWTSLQENVFLRLKNGSPRHNRHYKVRFYNEAGSLSSASGWHQLAPHASLNAALQTFLPQGSAWQNGSVEILFAGKGGGRLLGFGVGSEGAVPLQVGGLRHFFKEPKKKDK